MVTHTSDAPRGDDEAIEAERAAIIAYLSAVASEDDNPETNADDVVIKVVDHPEFPSMVRIIGTLDAEPNAPYLRSDFDPYAGVDHDLFAAEISNAKRDLEVLDGQE